MSHICKMLKIICLICLLLSPVLLFICAVLLGASLALGLTANAALFAALCVLFGVVTCAGFGCDHA